MSTWSALSDTVSPADMASRSALCNEGQQIIDSFPFKVNNFIQIVCSLAAIVVNVLFILKDWRGVYFHKNVKIIVAALIAANIGHSFFCVVLQGSHLYLYLTSSTGCEVLVPQYFCIILRAPMSTFLTSFVPFNTAIVLERWMATRQAGSYENKSGLIGSILVAVSLLLSVLLCMYIYSTGSLTGYSSYCSFSNQLTGAATRQIFYTGIAIEIVTLLGFVWVWKLNSNGQIRKIFDMRITYQNKENLTVLKLLLPLVLFHLLVFGAFNLANTLLSYFFKNINGINLKLAYSSLYIIPFYCLLSPFLLSWIAKKQKKTRKNQILKMAATVANQDNYHDYYRKLW